MNVDNQSSSQKVTSKYFSSSTGMDESLSDFQVKKKIAAPKSIKPKPKKPLKRPRGQKDIRKALKSKKSELETYAKDFDNVCKQSGIDVDSEQLQLAIALSKSIQPSISDSQSSESNSQERTARIRTTLQEYGFTVPEIKISNANRKVKKHRKNYKLLLLSEAEKQQNIADRYSQVLLQNIHNSSSPKKKVECGDFDKKLYFLTTSVCYEAIRDNNLYYLDNLSLEKSSNKDSLLRDWSEIPGRPVSPKSTKDQTMDISEILCSQEELNIILSGALKSAKNVIRKKLKVCQETKEDGVRIVNITERYYENNSVSFSNHALTEEPKFDEVESTNNESLIAEVKANSELARSGSPDIFDEEPTDFSDSEVDTNIHDSLEKVQIMEATNKSIILPRSLEKIHSIVSSQGLSQNLTKRKSNDVMELTECVGGTLNPSSCNTIRINATKRKTNDFMDLTECVIQEKVQIDLTQNSDETVSGDKIIEDIEIKDLTQSSSSNDSLPLVHVSDKNNDSVDNTIILNESEINDVIRSPEKENILIEATPEVDESNKESHLTSKTPPKNNISVEESSNDTFFDDFLYNHSNSPECSDSIIEKSTPEFGRKDDSKIDLTQSPDRNDNTETSEFKLEDNNTEIDLTQSPEKNNDLIERSESENKDNVEMDLTHNSTVLDNSNTNDILANKFELCNKSSLGKKDNISIDYDEITCNASSSTNKTNDCEAWKNTDSKEREYNSYTSSGTETGNSFKKHSEKLDASQTSKDSEVFEISDIELNYSIHKSRYEGGFEVNFGGISVIDNNSSSNRNSNLENDCSGDQSSNKCESDSFLPEVNIKRHEIPKESCKGLSPIKNTAINNIIETPRNNKSCMKHNAMYDIVKTPGNREYVIKTDQVTPMGDYMAMSTPDRNKELEKYGLKPLKRKRAIQLLTHIYNQTHPIVEPCASEVSQSPIKKRKTEASITLPSPTKSARENLGTKCSPTKIPKQHPISTTENVGINEKQISPLMNWKDNIRNEDILVDHEVKENIYEMTSERVEIRDIECGEEDWVFQKREKAKLLSCRVPLHIAFHNYVSCRRGLRQAILRYEPVNIDVIHRELANSGHRYDPKDLLKFLDKKCITVKTADNNRNKK